MSQKRQMTSLQYEQESKSFLHYFPAIFSLQMVFKSKVKYISSFLQVI